MIHPPNVGPRAGATSAVTPYSANAAPRSRGGKESAMIACDIGCRPPPPAPWSTLATSRIGKLGASPQSIELAVKSAMQIRKNRLRPTALVIQPVVGRTMALATR